jgi:hypothetical protein
MLTISAMNDKPMPPSPAVDLLTALSRGRTDAGVAALSTDAVTTVSQLQQQARGSTAGLDAWRQALELFPELAYKPASTPSMPRAESARLSHPTRAGDGARARPRQPR